MSRIPGLYPINWGERLEQEAMRALKAYSDRFTSCTHDFPDTGMKKSWCKHCDVEGHFSAELGQYLPE